MSICIHFDQSKSVIHFQVLSSRATEAKDMLIKGFKTIGIVENGWDDSQQAFLQPLKKIGTLDNFYKVLKTYKPQAETLFSPQPLSYEFSKVVPQKRQWLTHKLALNIISRRGNRKTQLSRLHEEQVSSEKLIQKAFSEAHLEAVPKSVG